MIEMFRSYTDQYSEGKEKNKKHGTSFRIMSHTMRKSKEKSPACRSSKDERQTGPNETHHLKRQKQANPTKNMTVMIVKIFWTTSKVLLLLEMNQDFLRRGMGN